MFRIALFALLIGNALGQRLTVLENEFVRVLDVTETSGIKGRPHEHATNRVMVYLTAGRQRLEYADGRSSVLDFKPGTPMWSPAGGVHTSQNLGGPFRVIEVELLKRPSGGFPPLQLDPVKVAPANYKVEIEQPEARVIRARMGPRDQVPMHEHGPNRVVIFLTDAHLRVIDESGTATQLAVPAGMVRWSGATRHREVNLAPAPFEVIAIELR